MKHRQQIAAFSQLLVYLFSIAMIGCGSNLTAPPPIITATPSPQQIQLCRDAMHIQPNLEIEPVGFYYADKFLDDHMAFKFVARTDDLASIFDPKFVPQDRLSPQRKMQGLNEKKTIQWWDPEDHDLTGGDFAVPPPNAKGTCGLKIGISDNGDDNFTVYAFWFET